MTPAFPPCPNLWKTLYRAAILETNKSVVPQRVSEAEEAVVARAREVFYGNSDAEEKEALEDALYALRAFKAAWPKGAELGLLPMLAEVCPIQRLGTMG